MSNALSGASALVGSIASSVNKDPLTSVVQRIAEHEEWWRPKLEYHAEQRWWTKLVSHRNLEVWLLTWLEDQTTDFHDHGSSGAAFTVVEGHLTESRFRRDGGIVAKTYSPGSVVTVAPRTIHAVSNNRWAPAASIHAYSPPLSTMTVYAPGNGKPTPLYSEIATGRENWR